MATRMQQRRGTAAQWTSTNDGDGPILEVGEIGFETDTGKFKIGDGINRWIDLDYFLDESEIDSITGDYVLSSTLGQNNGVATLDGSGNVPVSQLGNIIDAAPGALDTLNELAAALNDDANFATTVTNSLGNKQDKVSGVSDTEIGYLSNVTSDIQSQLNDKLESADLDEAAQDAINTALVAGTGIDKTYDDNANTITLNIDSTVTTNDGTQTLTNKTISGASNSLSNIPNAALDYDHITINGSAVSLGGSTTIDALPSQTGEGGKYLTTDGNNPSWSTIDLSSKQDVVAGVSDTEIGYLSNVTSDIQNQLDDKAPTDSPTFTGTVSGITGSMVGLGNVDNTSDLDKPISTATQSALDLKSDLASPTFTGTVTTDDLVVDGDFTVNGTNFAASATSIVIEDNMVQLAHQNAANTVDLGIVVGYNDGTAKHSGIVRDVSADKWKLFKGVTTEPATTVDFSEGSLDDLEVAGLTASSLTVGDVSNTEFGYLNGVTSAIQTQLDDKLNSSTASSTYAPLASPTFTGTVILPNNTVTNSMLSGSIANNKLSNSSVTINGESVSLGGSITIPTGATAQLVSSNISLQHNYNYFVDTSAARTLTLASAPSLGDTIAIIDAAGLAATNKITVDSNGGKINGTVQDLEIDMNNAAVVLIYTGSSYGWRVG
jgi:hypothetical protein